MDLLNARRFARRPRGSNVQDDAFSLGGGLNLVDPPLTIPPGQLLAVKNYEPAPSGGGYRRVLGYERYAEGFTPSRVSYTLLSYARATAVPVLGDILTGLSSGASGQVVAIVQSQPVTTINLALHSEDFGQAVWTFDGAVLGASNIPNPIDGTPNATFLSETTATAEHAVRATLAKPSEVKTYWLSIFIKPHGGTQDAALRAFNNVSFAQSTFHFSTGAAGSTLDNGDFLSLRQSMEIQTGGWWRVGLKFQSSVQPSLSLQIMCSTPGGELIYAGSPGSGLDIFGLQVEETTPDSLAPGPYVRSDEIIRGNGSGQIALMQVLTHSGVYTNAEQLRVASNTYAEASGDSTIGGAQTDELDKQFLTAVRTQSRALITSVPGSGPVRGVVVFNGVGIALRDNADATQGVLWRANAGVGWAQVDLGFKLRFHDGLLAGIAEGDTITGFASGASGVVRRVVVTSGGFDTNDAVGYLVFSSISGTFETLEQLRRGVTQVATASASQVAQTIAPGGRLETRVHNFFGHTKSTRLYAVDGKNHAFEYEDGVNGFFHQIETGMQDDKPTHLAIHHNQLWLAFTGGSLQRSSVGDPASWIVSLGAAEIAVGEEITGLLEEIGDTLFVFTRNRTHYVLGDSTGEALKPYAPETGAHERTIQRIGQGVYLDDRGLTSLAATQKYGNYVSNSFSSKIEPLIKELRRVGAVSSCVLKTKNIYRLFFADGRFVSVGIDGTKITGITSGDLGIKVSCAYSGEDVDGNELILFGSDADGFVYRMESGPAFDGGSIQAFFRTAFHHSRSPQRRKRYRRAALHIQTSGPCSLSVGTDYSFADPSEAIESIRSLSMSGGGGIWNVSQWNQFRWSAGVVADASIKLDASGTNIGFLVSHEADDEEEHTISSIMLSLSPRRRNRGTSHG